MSDHCGLYFNYKTKNTNIKPKYGFFMDKHLLTSHELGNFKDYNLELNTIFHLQDPNFIAEPLLREFNLIVKIIAPKKGSN